MCVKITRFGVCVKSIGMQKREQPTDSRLDIVRVLKWRNMWTTMITSYNSRYYTDQNHGHGVSLAVTNNLELHSVDIEQDFSQADKLPEGVNGRYFVNPPPGSPDSGNKDIL